MRRMSGFSLMEMMVVLLITAIVAAASAPMINKKLMHDQAESGSPWIYTGLNNSIAYNIKNNPDMTVSIGATKPLLDLKPRLHLGKASEASPHITLKDSANDATINSLTRPDGTDRDSTAGSAYAEIDYRNGTISFGPSARGSNSVVLGRAAGLMSGMSGMSSVAIGYRTTADSRSVSIGADAYTAEHAVAIGEFAYAEDSSVAIGAQRHYGNYGKVQKTEASGVEAIAIGSGTIAKGQRAIAIGKPKIMGFDFLQGNASGDDSIAIGTGAIAQATNSVAIGNGAEANYENSVAIGAGAVTANSKQIVLGTKEDTVYIPGNLVVGGYSILGYEPGKHAHIRMYQQYSTTNTKLAKIRYNNTASNLELGSDYNDLIPGFPSDRRLKNVGKAFVGGLEDVKKLEVFNYTYKKDPTKTPHVGVMAQDLEKIFPKAVFKGDDGFLRIRMEDMFYAVVNAIKELDSKFEALRNNEIKTLQKQVADLEKQNKELLKRIEKIEKNLK